ncbi:MAG: hypothetical protein KDD73_00360 [Anaerolineales bacterium]|nr:hypothetical protein [Anaerolineales bacterium]MCB9127918.1 hypothetical protein [Ardenticatenales bacterium]MCB9171680.1 hypothetical protein [Ardenticatenales bacterium]
MLVASHVAALGWETLAAAQLSGPWLGRLYLQPGQLPLLINQEGQPLHLVSDQPSLGPYGLWLPPDLIERMRRLPHDLYAWRVGQTVWVGDEIIIHLPRSAPWDSHLSWQPPAEGREALGRGLALLSDWLLARSPDGTLSSMIGELLQREHFDDVPLPDRTDLSAANRLLRWRASRLLTPLLGALAEGRMAQVEELSTRLAGLGGDQFPLGDQFVMGFVAGLRQWPHFTVESSGLKAEPVLHRMVHSVVQRTTPLSRVSLFAAFLDQRWGWRWHALHHALWQTSDHADQRRDALHRHAEAWFEAMPDQAGAALAGFVAPFLWHQRHVV